MRTPTPTASLKNLPKHPNGAIDWTAAHADERTRRLAADKKVGQLRQELGRAVDQLGEARDQLDTMHALVTAQAIAHETMPIDTQDPDDLRQTFDNAIARVAETRGQASPPVAKMFHVEQAPSPTRDASQLPLFNSDMARSLGTALLHR